jgi:hypothetical protein
MSGQLSTVGANSALDAATGRATQTARTVYLALLTALPTDSTTMATMTEVFTPGTNGYARQACAWTAPSGDPSTSSNSGTLTFGPFSADPASVAYAALVSASTGTVGDFIAYWTANVAQDAASGQSIQVSVGALTLSID